jgi:hypothetical protein
MTDENKKLPREGWSDVQARSDEARRVRGTTDVDDSDPAPVYGGPPPTAPAYGGPPPRFTGDRRKRRGPLVIAVIVVIIAAVVAVLALVSST